MSIMSALSTDIVGWCTVVAALVTVISFAYTVWVNIREARARELARELVSEQRELIVRDRLDQAKEHHDKLQGLLEAHLSMLRTLQTQLGEHRRQTVELSQRQDAQRQQQLCYGTSWELVGNYH